MPIPTEEERLSTLIAGRYRLESILGRGGTGVVFEGVHTWTGRRVAVKLLKPEYARDLGLVRRFLQEARVAAGIEHPHVIEVLDMGAEPDGTVYLVLELLEGETLGTVLERRGRLPADETLQTLLPVMDALAFAHRRDILHRDLKPDNVFIRRDATGQRVPTLLDFGMARMVQQAWGHATQSGTLVGTPFYMSPEQAEGEREVGPPSDVWSMGVILYRCLTGRLPFEASTPTALLLAIVQTDPIPVADLAPEVPERIAAAVDRAIVRDLDTRWPRIEALAEELREAAAQAGIDVPARLGDEAHGEAATDTEQASPRDPQRGAAAATETTGGSRHAMAWAAAGALVIAAAAIAAIGLWAGEPEAAATESGAPASDEAAASAADDDGADAPGGAEPEPPQLAARHAEPPSVSDAEQDEAADDDASEQTSAPARADARETRSAAGTAKEPPGPGQRSDERGAGETEGSTDEPAGGDDAAEGQEPSEEPGSLPGVTSEW